MLKQLSWTKLLSANSYRAFLKNSPLIRPTWLSSHTIWGADRDLCLRLMLSFPLVHACLSQHLSFPHPSPVFTIHIGYNYSRRCLSSYTHSCCPMGIFQRGWEGVLSVLEFYFQGIRKLFSLTCLSIQIYLRSEYCLFIWLVISWPSAESKAMKG